MGNAKDRSRGLDELKNRSGKCEGPVGGDRWVKESEWEMRRIGRGGRRDKEPEWEMRRTGARGGGDQRLFEKKSFFKNQRHQPNIVEITHLCIGIKVRCYGKYVGEYIGNLGNILGTH